MAKKPQLLQITPSVELVFREKDDGSGISYSKIELHNPSNQDLMFKVKTTAPKRYCVRPNSGIIEKNGTISVEVMLPPCDATTDEKSKHKFMVQSASVSDGDTTNVDSLWKHVDSKEIMDSKLKCTFVSEDSGIDSSKAPLLNSAAPPPPSRPIDGAGGGDSRGAHDNITSTSSYTTSTGSVSEQDDFGQPVGQRLQPPHTKQAVKSEDVEHLQELIKKLTHEMNVLRSENSQLREEGVLRQRVSGKREDYSSSSSMTAKPNISTTTPVFPPVIYIIAAIIIGLIIGKFLLP